MKIAVALKGATFLKSSGTLIRFACSMGWAVHVFYARHENDSLSESQLKGFERKAIFHDYDDEIDLLRKISKLGIKTIIAQDAPHHFPQLCETPHLSVYSISVFIDTLHYAWRVAHQEEKKSIPYKTYFPCTYIEDKFFSIGGFHRDEVRFKTLGSPLLDHSLFVSEKTEDPYVIFIAPPLQMMNFLLIRRLRALFIHIRKNGVKVIAKDRQKTPLAKSLYKVCDELYSQETLLPYASLNLIAKSKLHICGYSTSIFEARYFSKPTINIDINLRKATMPNFVDNYQIRNLYSSKTCITDKSNFCETYDQLINLSENIFEENDQFITPNSVCTSHDNASVRILRDIEYEC